MLVQEVNGRRNPASHQRTAAGLEDAVKAHELGEPGRVSGKLVLSV